jgi:hypothetical protein
MSTHITAHTTPLTITLDALDKQLDHTRVCRDEAYASADRSLMRGDDIDMHTALKVGHAMQTRLDGLLDERFCMGMGME